MTNAPKFDTMNTDKKGSEKNEKSPTKLKKIKIMLDKRIKKHYNKRVENIK